MLKKAPFVDIGFAKVDMHRAYRQGTPEVIYGTGKTVEQIRAIADTMLERGQNHILITRIDDEKAEALKDIKGFTYHPEGRMGIVGDTPDPDGIGTVLIVTAGTSDIPVAEEAALTAEALGNKVLERLEKLDDVAYVRFASVYKDFQNIEEFASALEDLR